MKKATMGTALALGLSACTVSEDPADGGFLSGVVGIAGGGYEQRVADSEFALAQAQAQAQATQSQQQQSAAQSEELAAQISQLRAEFIALQQSLSAKIAQLNAAGKTVDQTLLARVNTVVAASPGGSNDAQRLASLQAAIADARALSAQLAQI